MACISLSYQGLKIWFLYGSNKKCLIYLYINFILKNGLEGFFIRLVYFNVVVLIIKTWQI
ncbi:hypothetical protein ADP71_40960 [Vitreoscilla sp. C1]|nr:hypothetical protein ADP71_40960 [Vitreoscilla sp. C1]